MRFNGHLLSMIQGAFLSPQYLSLSLFSLVGKALWRIILLQIIPILFESRVKQKTLSQIIQRQRCCEIQERGGRP